MHRFWKVLIEPILEASQSKQIVEIGAWQGTNTLNLLEYCQQQKGFLEIIEPLPLFENNQSLLQFKEFYTLHEDLSLNILPKLNPFDAVLIDGDHNWYTVFHELQCIEKKHLHEPSNFPIILMHDMSWPYARRDLYYNPENIPDEYRHEHARSGIVPGQSKVDETFFFNSHLQNTIHEGGDKNGVLTALEDYIEGSSLDFEFVKIPFFYGLGIVISRQRLIAQPKLATFINKIFTPDGFVKICAGFENLRIEEYVELSPQIVQISKEKEEALQALQKYQSSRMVRWYFKLFKK